MIKPPGCCSISGEECFEVLERWPDSHALYAGLPCKLGKPHPDALRLTLVLCDGSLMNLTIKARHLGEVHAMLPTLWSVIKATTRAIRKGHRALRQQDFTPEQNAAADAGNLRQNDNVPLGVLCWERWETLQGEIAHVL